MKNWQSYDENSFDCFDWDMLYMYKQYEDSN